MNKEEGCGKEFHYKGYLIKCGKEQIIDSKKIKKLCSNCKLNKILK